MQTLVSDQLNRLVEIINDDFGPKLNQDQFNDAAMNMFDNIAGCESLPAKTRTQYLNKMWTCYKKTNAVNQSK
jgi:hypothetical protein